MHRDFAFNVVSLGDSRKPRLRQKMMEMEAALYNDGQPISEIMELNYSLLKHFYSYSKFNPKNRA